MRGRKAAAVVAAVALFYVGLETLGVTCPIKFLTGISCAGCGMSRAWLALLRGDLAAAFAFHPLVLAPPLMAGWFLARKRLGEKVFSAGVWALGALFAAVYLTRLALPGEVVVFAPWEGALWRLVARMLG